MQILAQSLYTSVPFWVLLLLDIIILAVHW